MHLSPQEYNQLECSIYHYFVWRQESTQTCYAGTNADAKDDESTSFDTSTTHSPIDSTPLQNSFNRIIQVLKEELPHVTAPETLSLSSSTPEVCFRWIKYATLRNIIRNTDIPGNTKRKRDIADEDDKSTKALKSALKDSTITPEDAKEVLSTLRKEHSEAKQLAESLESKLSKSEKFNSELLRFQQEKLRLEKRLAHFESESEKTEQKVDDQQVNDNEAGDVKLANLRTKFEKKKLRIELQESMYANAIVHKVQEKNKQTEARNYWDFETRLQQLIEFKQEFGHCEVGNECNPGLYQWVKRYRQYFRNGSKSLTPERIAKLDALGMVWEPDLTKTQRTFQERIVQCRAFKEAHGHLRIPLVSECNVDGTEPSEYDARFRLWAQSMRRQYQAKAAGRQAALKKHSIAILDSLGFQWSLDATSVEGGDISAMTQTPEELQYRNRIEQLRKVKEICGNCNEKKHILSVFPNNYSLYTWAKTQRKHMKFWLAGKKNRLNDERLEMLRSIDFDHEPRKHYAPALSSKKEWPTRMEILALELKERKNNPDSENASEYDDSDFDEELQTKA